MNFVYLLSFLISDLFIKDALSLERNYILVKTFMIGGPTERTLPSRTLEKVCYLLL